LPHLVRRQLGGEPTGDLLFARRRDDEHPIAERPLGVVERGDPDPDIAYVRSSSDFLEQRVELLRGRRTVEVAAHAGDIAVAFEELLEREQRSRRPTAVRMAEPTYALSDSFERCHGVGPNTCAQRPPQGGAQFAHANCVTHKAVRCSAWLGGTDVYVQAL